MITYPSWMAHTEVFVFLHPSDSYIMRTVKTGALICLVRRSIKFSDPSSSLIHQVLWSIKSSDPSSPLTHVSRPVDDSFTPQLPHDTRWKFTRHRDGVTTFAEPCWNQIITFSLILWICALLHFLKIQTQNIVFLCWNISFCICCISLIYSCELFPFLH